MQGSILYDPEVCNLLKYRILVCQACLWFLGTPAVGQRENRVTFLGLARPPQGELADGQVMAKLCFQPLVDSGRPLWSFPKQPTPIELIDGNLRLLSATFLALKFKLVVQMPVICRLMSFAYFLPFAKRLVGASLRYRQALASEPLAYSWTGPNALVVMLPPSKL
ncbi:hypothetical protein D5R40_31145 [Okeania hirsuta]|uniref:Uncharacterized protein n=1 Tax=Okeania hirsuta TaxID=1458930 RepID=A0A3N6PBV4_9CYAN|nr:hypothetical protein D5R40_31145 [Okeania hirsuta]